MSQDVADQVRAYMRNNVQSVYGDWNFNGMNVCAKSGNGKQFHTASTPASLAKPGWVLVDPKSKNR